MCGKQGSINEHSIPVRSRLKYSIISFIESINIFNFHRVVFDEDFVFEERPSIIGRRTIEILLYDFDAYSRHVCIGGTQIQLGQLDLSKKVVLWNPLGSCSEQVSMMKFQLIPLKGLKFSPLYRMLKLN